MISKANREIETLASDDKRKRGKSIKGKQREIGTKRKDKESE